MNSRKIKLFVYGTLKKGCDLHSFYLENSEFVKKDSVFGKLYAFCGLPFLVLDGEKTSQVPGEIYNVSNEVFENIKAMEEGAGYRTVKVPTVEEELVYTFSYDKSIISTGKRIKKW